MATNLLVYRRDQDLLDYYTFRLEAANDALNVGIDR